ncbi:MAG: ABC transporter permease subunit [Alphaproteobacteria bacterium]|nr:ABC transporter permease subunit [Alphaproteobacteria bacterium]MCB9794473.1 ABC transporter permease subunit [Alphaproteobacteria bacterium]
MNSLRVMLRKEALEQLRTHRLLLFGALFAFIGLGSPLTARLLPELLGAVPQDQLQGMEILLLREPDLRDALLQYHKNFGLLPLIIILSAMGSVARELSDGTAAMWLAKPLDRRAWLLAKFLVPAGVLTLGTALAAAGCAAYCAALFTTPHLPTFAAANGLLLLQVLFSLALTLLASSMTRSSGAAAGVAVGVTVALGLVSISPSLAAFTPGGLGLAAAELLQGRAVERLGLTLGVGAGGVLLFLAAALRRVQRMEI